MTKICKKCGIEKQLEDLAKNKESTFGRRALCKSCKNERSRRYREEDPEKANAYHREYYHNKQDKDKSRKTRRLWKEKNKDKIREQDKAWQEANRERRQEYHRELNRIKVEKDPTYSAVLRARSKKWRKANRDKANAQNAKRRAIKLKATPPWLTPEHFTQILQFYTTAQELTKTTGIIHEVDHIIPLQGKNVSGLHVPWNLQILTKTENSRKKNKII